MRARTRQLAELEAAYYAEHDEFTRPEDLPVSVDGLSVDVTTGGKGIDLDGGRQPSGWPSW